jgi:DNA-binding transcriptional LysR family regulator
MDWTERIGSRIKLRDLHILLAVAEWGSMAEAAKRLAISQPVVSKAIADLERSIGVRLFDRTARGVEPTVFGRALLNRGIAVFDELRQSVQDVRFLRDSTSGEVRIGSTDSIAGGVLAAVIARLSLSHPRLTFHVRTDDTTTLLYHELRDRAVELLFGRIAPPVDENLETEVLFQEYLCVVAGHSSPWARRRRIAIADLADANWIFGPPDNFIGTREALKASGLPNPKVTATAYSIHFTTTLIATGRFLGILPRSMLHLSAVGRMMKILPVKLIASPRPVAILRLKNRTLSPMAELFIENARIVAKPLATEFSPRA